MSFLLTGLSEHLNGRAGAIISGLLQPLWSADFMRYIKILVRIAVVAVFLAFLDYTLPSRDIVKIVGTEVVRTDIAVNSIFWASPDADQAVVSGTGNRDVRFINSVKPNENARVYRNEDTGWGWPPYFKFSSGDLQAEAQQLAGTEQWVAVNHYGWRIRMLSIYPNAVGISSVSGPGVTLIPWMRIIAAVLLALFGLAAWRIIVRLREWMADKFDRLKARY